MTKFVYAASMLSKDSLGNCHKGLMEQYQEM